ncbi:MAG TPA: cytochrome c biogenesis protein CcdA, partial [Acetobacteraceae bacterium]|nr:cytochrome c biogenesis protein CcdA [Acetobacteraceae bacterium]
PSGEPICSLAFDPSLAPQHDGVPMRIGQFVPSWTANLSFSRDEQILIATPCASPILVFVLGAVSLVASPARAVAAMTLYAIGYTLVLFLASLFAGIAAASRRILAHAELVSRVAAVMLVIIGVAVSAYGLQQL